MGSSHDGTNSAARLAALRIAFVALGLASLGPVAPASAATSCVSPGGAGGCFASIQAAVDAARTGTLILVSAGTYVENVVLPRQRPIALQGAGSVSTIVDGGGNGPVLSFAGERTRLVLSGVTLRNGVAATPQQGAGLDGSASLKLAMSDVIVEGNDGHGIVLPGRSRFSITHSAVRGNGGSGIVGDFLTLSMSDATVDDNQGIGLHATGGKLSVVRSSLSRNALDGLRAAPSTHGGINGRPADLTLVDAVIADNGSVVGAGLVFSGTERSGRLQVQRTTVSGNASAARGGGIWISRAKAVIDASTISGNSSPEGGGINIEHLGRRTVEIARSTISGNVAGTGGGISLHGGIGLRAVRIVSSTIAENAASVRGGGIHVHPALLPPLATASIVANNTSAGPGADCDGSLISGGWLLLETASGCTVEPAAGDASGLDPLLGPLQPNGGPTATQALLPGSPALAVVTSNAICRVADQRGEARVVPCDVGAFEAP